MKFKYDGGVKLKQGEVFRHVWQRDAGNLVVVVIDDELQFADPDINDLSYLQNDQACLPMLRDQTLEWSYTRAIGFFPLAENPDKGNEVLEYIKRWLDTVINPPDTRVYFLVDIVHGVGQSSNIGTSQHVTDQLIEKYSHNPDHIRYITRGGGGPNAPISEENFDKGIEYSYFKRNGKVSQKILSFFGIGSHTDGIISHAIQFYAKAWELNWNPQGWAHDYLQGNNRNSPHLQALAEWLGDSVSIDDLVSNNTVQTESAKSLMIWHEEDLWNKENPPWKARDRRRIKGKVLNAVLRKLGIPLSKTNPIPDEGLITMPCVPCFPFLVSLRGFLWRCEEEEEEISVSEMCFFQLGENPQVNIFRLVLPLRNPVELAQKFFGIGEERAGAFTNSLRNLTCCRTEGLDGTGDYMSLFTNGTEAPVVAVEIAPKQINLIWSVR